MQQKYTRDFKLREKYGIGIEEYEELLEEQDFGCAICGQMCTRSKSLAVDHDHKTGHIRGLLCKRCNQGIGQFEDNADLLWLAWRYLCK